MNPDAVAMLTAVSVASAGASAACYAVHHIAGRALERLSVREIGEHLRAALPEPLRELLPEPMGDLLDELHRKTGGHDGTVAAPRPADGLGTDRAGAPDAAGERARGG